ncbi:MAG TPA: hypothetical protein VHZ31_03600 [Solirubrobacteraceae bacterium]|jgi:hypothetical protein|nr:hypothetical protein [Solirubrobacteraceae bacterium]
MRLATSSLPLAAITAVVLAGATVAPAAGAQAPARAAAATPAKVTGAYLFVQKILTAGQHGSKLDRYATLVFKTDRQLPRRYDGLIRAGASIAGGGGGSLGSVGGRATRCYEMNTRIRLDNTILGDGHATKARPGSRLHVEITTASGATAVTRTLTLHDAKPGDASGKPLRC